jgi:tryptophan synthase alpha chain
LSESRLAPAWAGLKARGRTALIPYLTAGYPSTETSLQALRAADEVADILEVGVPFSDPLADGPTIQRSTFDALRQGMTLAGTLALIERAQLTRPVVVFSYLNPILRYGLERFLHDADALGLAGLLLTDLPAGSDPAVECAVQSSPLDLIRLIAPTTRPDRLASAVAGAQGFVYLVARLGVTGASASLAAGLEESVARVRRATALPVAVGFGISNAEQARAVARVADGVVVGSALVDRLGGGGVDAARRFLLELRGALEAREVPA